MRGGGPRGPPLFLSGTGTPKQRGSPRDRWRHLALEHRKDQLPVALRALLVEDIAVGERVAMLRACVDRVGVADLARLQELAELSDHRQGRVVVELREAAIKFAAQLGDV